MMTFRSTQAAPFLALSLLFLTTSTAASGDQDQPLFEDKTALNLRIEAPFNTLFKDLLNEDKYVEGTLYILNSDGQEQALPIKVKPRGKTRRNKDFCKFPPLTVNFKEKQTGGTVFEGQDKLKLVTHCQNRSSAYQQYYHLEHLIYETYNLFTEASYDVRLAQIDYLDTEGKQSIAGKFGFFIEDSDLLAERTGMERRKVKKIRIAELDGDTAALVSIFQYFIGNLDWSLLGGPPDENCCHNAKLFVTTEGQTIPVPYDFDHAGVINARYATPPEGVAIRNVRQRVFRGFCKHNGDLETALQAFKDKKTDVYSLIQDSEHLKSKVKSSTIKYYDQFYAIVENPKKAKREFYDKCRGKP